MSNPLVSIITPCFNGERFLDRYFDSILSQTYDNMEVFFINDGSTDRTEEIALNYKQPLVAKGIQFRYLKQVNSGQAAAVNCGLKLFSGEYLTWPDSDDLMTENCIEEKVCFLEEHPEYGVCICKTAIANEGDLSVVRSIMERKVPDGEDLIFEDMMFLRNIYFSPGGYMVRAKALLDVIPARDIYSGRGGQNAQILLPVFYKYKCGYIDRILNTYVVREDSHSHQIKTSEKEIEQNKLYQTILLETLKRMGQDVYKQYEQQIRDHYGHIVFGNAIDSGDKDLIRDAYDELKANKCLSKRDKLLFLKHVIL